MKKFLNSKTLIMFFTACVNFCFATGNNNQEKDVFYSAVDWAGQYQANFAIFEAQLSSSENYNDFCKKMPTINLSDIFNKLEDNNDKNVFEVNEDEYGNKFYPAVYNFIEDFKVYDWKNTNDPKQAIDEMIEKANNDSQLGIKEIE